MCGYVIAFITFGMMAFNRWLCHSFFNLWDDGVSWVVRRRSCRGPRGWRHSQCPPCWSHSAAQPGASLPGPTAASQTVHSKKIVRRRPCQVAEISAEDTIIQWLTDLSQTNGYEIGGKKRIIMFWAHARCLVKSSKAVCLFGQKRTQTSSIHFTACKALMCDISV